MDLQDIRDVIVVAAVVGLSLVAFVLLLVYTFVGYKTWRGIRRLNRLHEDQLRLRLDSFNDRVGDLLEDGAFTGSGLVALAIGGVRAVRERRKPKKRRFRIPGIR